jgi:hypothetical protein
VVNVEDREISPILTRLNNTPQFYAFLDQIVANSNYPGLREALEEGFGIAGSIKLAQGNYNGANNVGSQAYSTQGVYGAGSMNGLYPDEASYGFGASGGGLYGGSRLIGQGGFGTVAHGGYYGSSSGGQNFGTAYVPGDFGAGYLSTGSVTGSTFGGPADYGYGGMSTTMSPSYYGNMNGMSSSSGSASATSGGTGGIGRGNQYAGYGNGGGRMFDTDDRGTGYASSTAVNTGAGGAIGGPGISSVSGYDTQSLSGFGGYGGAGSSGSGSGSANGVPVDVQNTIQSSADLKKVVNQLAQRGYTFRDASAMVQAYRAESRQNGHHHSRKSLDTNWLFRF